MRKFLLLSLLTTALAFPLRADNHGRSQSYISFDDGGTTIRQGDDGKEVEARLNFPVYPGDEVITNRRGRTEIRLSDGNVIALDRSTDVFLKSAKDSYDGDANLTVVELRYGHVMIEREDDGNEPIRLDTDSASYAATEPAIYALDTDRGRDRIAVFNGAIEVRTPARTTKIRSGEEGHVDDQGLYDVVSENRGGGDDFERWFIKRAQLYRGSTSRYLDHSLAYSTGDLDSYGSWVYVNDYSSWCWRPRVDVGWRPFYNGSWHYGRGSAVWVSFEPWGWVPYHYGRWAYDPFNGWVWLPGYAYSPAWVYWLYGPGYVGWAPAGWFDCYRPYYGWAYRPYARVGWGWGGGFYGRVRLHDIDMRPWVFVHPNSFISTRIDHAALNADIIRQRIGHEGFATVSSVPARFTRSELRDPAAAIGVIARRGVPGGGTGKGSSGTVADMTSFFRRDPELPSTVRDRVIRGRNLEPSPGIGTPRGVGSGIPTPGTGGTLEGRVPRDGGSNRQSERPATGVIGRGGVAGGTVAADQGSWRTRQGGLSPATTPDRGAGTRGTSNPATNAPAPPDRATVPPSDRGSWRNRDNGGAPNRGNNGNNGNNGNTNNNTPPPGHGRLNRDVVTFPERSTVSRGGYDVPATPRNDRPRNEEWRRPSTPRDGGSYTPRDTGNSGRDIPRRVIDGIGGARIYSGDRPSSTPRTYTPPPPRSSGSSGGNAGSSHSGGGHANGGNSNGGNSGGGHSSGSNSGGNQHHGH